MVFLLTCAQQKPGNLYKKSRERSQVRQGSHLGPITFMVLHPFFRDRFIVQIGYCTILILVPWLYSWLCIFYQWHWCLARQRHSCLEQKRHFRSLHVIWIPDHQTCMIIDSAGSYTGRFYGCHVVMISVGNVLTSILFKMTPHSLVFLSSFNIHKAALCLHGQVPSPKSPCTRASVGFWCAHEQI